MDIEEVERRAAEHGNVEGWSANDSRKAVAARRHFAAPDWALLDEEPWDIFCSIMR